MTKYNSPHDTDLIGIMQNMSARIQKLERFSRPASQVYAPGLRADTYDTPVIVTSATFVTTHYFPCPFIAPTPIVRILVVVTDDTTTGEFQLTDSLGNVLTDAGGNAVPPTVIPANTIVETAFENNQSPNYWNDYPIGTDLMYQLQVRRTSGVGELHVRSKYLFQSPS